PYVCHARTLCSLYRFHSHRSVAHPYLHSFPTRRSSDLHASAIQVVPHTWGDPLGMVANLHLAASIPNTSYFEFPHDPPAFPANVDRKSTRLNSSHGSISYAVFCLKKKKLDYNISVMTAP